MQAPEEGNAPLNSSRTFGNEPIAANVAKQRKTSKFILTKYTIYETKERMYIVGSNKRETMFRILEIDITVPENELTVLEDNIFLTRNEIMDVLSELEDASDEGLQKKLTGYGLLGCIRFTSCYYLVVVTSFSQVAVIGGHSVYHIDGTELIPISNTYKKPEKNSTEAKLMTTFQNLDLTKTFYFSYTYDITNSLQTNLLREKLKAIDRSDISIPTGIPNCNEMYMWNSNLLRPLFNCIDTVYDWFQCIIQGFIDQVNVSILGKSIYITLLARRSHHFAGARFLKRGVNTQGFVANEVETEQIVSDMILTPFHQPGLGYFDNSNYTSFVQHRGSIPLYWSQETSNLTAKPPIQINVVDPYFSAAALHFDRLFQRYGGGMIQVLNLIKTKEKNPRETKLLKEFEQCVTYLNRNLPQGKKIDYVSWDMSRASKQDGQKVIEFLETYAMKTVSQTGIFHNGSDFKSTKIQEGICRSNCIDCLDRTNAAQFVIGKRALGVQLKELGIIEDVFLEYDSDIVNILTELFHDLGDTIALQYGGSHLVNTMETYRKINQWSSHSRDMVESIKRFYSNSFIDAQRQDAINLFLGNYVWSENSTPIWEMNTDFYLHNEYQVSGPKRSYIHWWNNYHIQSIRELIEREVLINNNDITIEKLRTNIRGYPDAFDNYYNEYYLPRCVTWIQDLFAYNMNSTRRYKTKTNKNDASPFKSRKQSWLNKTLKTLLWENSGECKKPDNNSNKNASEGLKEIKSSLVRDELSLSFGTLENMILPNRIGRSGMAHFQENRHPETDSIRSNITGGLLIESAEGEAKEGNEEDTHVDEVLESRHYYKNSSVDIDFYRKQEEMVVEPLQDYMEVLKLDSVTVSTQDYNLYKDFLEIDQGGLLAFE